MTGLEKNADVNVSVSYNVFLLGHSGRLHSLVSCSNVLPEHGSPPAVGLGLVQALDRVATVVSLRPQVLTQFG